jgi:hypothetical protein
MLIWGHKTLAMFDVWSLEHFVNGICMAGVASWITVKASKKLEINHISRKIIVILIVVIGSLFWECVEHYIESGILTGEVGARVTHWFQGVEHWSNRLIGDTLTVLLGCYVYFKNKKLVVPAKIFTIVWMAVHIFVFPDSMYLQRLLFP